MAKLNPNQLTKIRDIDPELISYNIEMTEVTGGTFWKEYTPEQIAGTEEFPPTQDFSELSNLMQVYPPIDLKEKRIRTLAKALGPAHVRVSGSWATNTYYDFDGQTNGKVPAGYQSVMTKEQWDNILEFVKEIDSDLMISVANCPGAHNSDGSWNPEQATMLLNYSRDHGVPVTSSEFMNEPNMLDTGPRKGYLASEYAKDQDDYFTLLKEKFPECRTVGCSACGDDITGGDQQALPAGMRVCSSDEIMGASKMMPDIFSYHCYSGISERGKIFGNHWDVKDVLMEKYLAIPSVAAKYYAKMRDKYCPNAPMWVTETADAGCGGNTWASTYLDIIRYAEELSSFSTITDGALFHNTLASSDYGLLDHVTHLPRPSYWLAWIWNQLVGTTVYDTHEPLREGMHVYAHSRRDGKPGYCYIVINNSKNEETIEIPSESTCYQLSAKELRGKTVLLNGQPLSLTEDEQLPTLEGKPQPTGVSSLPSVSVTFFVL